MTDNVQIYQSGAAGRISLDRPKALHALTTGMCEAISAALVRWRADPSVDVVILDHASGRGFCAGGDVALVRRSVLEDGGIEGRAFFRAEYRLNHLMFHYPKPIVTFMDGVTMGGGVGLSLPARWRIATENTLFAMPEGAIGLFPDIGAGWYLPRLPHNIGPFLALTGARLDGAECLWTGIATHYLPAPTLEETKNQISTNTPDIKTILDSFSAPPPPARIAANAERISHHFASSRLEGILAFLAADESKWAAKELKSVAAKCPTSSKVALRQFSRPQPDFTQEMALEYRLASRMIARPDFAEGVRAVLVDKDNQPRWNPATPEAVTEASLDAIFAPAEDRDNLSGDQENSSEIWTPYPA